MVTIQGVQREVENPLAKELWPNIWTSLWPILDPRIRSVKVTRALADDSNIEAGSKVTDYLAFYTVSITEESDFFEVSRVRGQ